MGLVITPVKLISTTKHRHYFWVDCRSQHTYDVRKERTALDRDGTVVYIV